MRRKACIIGFMAGLLMAPAVLMAQDSGEEAAPVTVGPLRSYGPSYGSSAPDNILDFEHPDAVDPGSQSAPPPPAQPPMGAASTPEPPLFGRTEGTPPSEWDNGSDPRRGSARSGTAPASTSPSPAPVQSQREVPAAPEDASDVVLRGKARILNDGQSLLLDGRIVRLDKIHAPKPDALCHRNYLYSWHCGKRSRDSLAKLLAGHIITCHGRIRVGEATVARCIRNDGLDLASMMVRQGMAVVHRQYFDDYLEEERVAKDSNLGLWSGQFEPPWEN